MLRLSWVGTKIHLFRKIQGVPDHPYKVIYFSYFRSNEIGDGKHEGEIVPKESEFHPPLSSPATLVGKTGVPTSKVGMPMSVKIL